MALVHHLGELTGSSQESKGRRILLLQGPVGPYFRVLQKSLESCGAKVTRVLFNAGDVLFGPRGSVRFTGSLDDWSDWMEREIDRNRPDEIVLFGLDRYAVDADR